ncbi:MAG: class I SAM-dependent methyltransferase [Acidobacteria bacterium]|nr:class I SAM-dependent methyltransferase [Acidobacteriota bacterium]
MTEFARRVISGGAAVAVLAGAVLAAQVATTQKPFEPKVGQAGKDVVWVPTPQPTVDAMLDMAKLTKSDFLVDLGSGDGITVITAAKRGARAMGVEFNPDMVALARQRAEEAGMSASATFVQGDFFKTDFSKANVLTMFLLPSLNEQLRPTILNMKPGTRVVTNTFRMGSGEDEWLPEAEKRVDPCETSWCTAILYVVPAKVAPDDRPLDEVRFQGPPEPSVWSMNGQVLKLYQKFQFVTGLLGNAAITEGKLLGYDITFTVGGQHYTGRVSEDGKMIKGTSPAGAWTASR